MQTHYMNSELILNQNENWYGIAQTFQQTAIWAMIFTGQWSLRCTQTIVQTCIHRSGYYKYKPFR